MEFSDLLTKVQQMQLAEVRVTRPTLFEGVVRKEDLGSLCQILEEFFGPAFKPAGAQPSKEALSHSDKYGGVRKNQTLYYKGDGSANAIGLLWPWGDESLITIKIFLESK